VTFDGHGTDADGDVVAYRWRSSLDGDLSAKASFETSSLSEGVHIIYLKVQDNNGDWSDEVRVRVIVSGVTAGAPVVNSFDANPGSISLGASSTLSWNVSGATTVNIDQEVGDVALSGTRVVYLSTTTTYTLTATTDAGSATATAQVVVGSSSEAESETESEAESEEVSEYTVTLHSIPGEDGNIRQGAPDPFTNEILVGDDQHNKAWQAFLSFDISGIPASSTILSRLLSR